MPTVSVIIPTYNRASTIGQAVESVLAQTYADFEAIIVDDGSTDRTCDVVAPYVARSNGRVRYLLQPNAGAPAARNLGIRKARGEYVVFLDSDDLYLPGRLEAGVRPLLTAPDVGASYVDARVMDAQGAVLLPSWLGRWGGARSGWILADLFRVDLVQTNTVTIRRRVFDDVGLFDEVLWSGQDTDLWWRIARRYQIVGVPECQAVIREIGTSLSRGEGKAEDRLKRLPIWIQGQGRYLTQWADLAPNVLRLLAMRIWDLHFEQACLLATLGKTSESLAVQTHMRQLARQHALRWHVIRRRLGRRLPGLQRAWHALPRHAASRP